MREGRGEAKEVVKVTDAEMRSVEELATELKEERQHFSSYIPSIIYTVNPAITDANGPSYCMCWWIYVIANIGITKR